MNIHQNARLTVHGREAMVREVVSGATTVQEAAEEFRTCPATVRKWLRRYQLEGVEGMIDRSSRPVRAPGRSRSRRPLRSRCCGEKG